MQVYQHQQPFQLEVSGSLPSINIAFHTWGRLNEERTNVVWICHALTANSNADDWWPGLIGEDLVFDPRKYFIVCANIFGSCYGTTGPGSVNPHTQKPYHHQFPFVTIRDMVNAHELLRQHLNIQRIHLLVGGSMGGYQALEWAVMQPMLIKRLFLLATSPKESPWGIAIHTAQRNAIAVDPTWKEDSETAGLEGLKVARAIGMITYRSYETFAKTQTDTDDEKVNDFKASSYINYQGKKLADRFSAYSYWTLTQALDTHNLARGRGGMPNALGSIEAKTLILGITTDLLCPINEQKTMAEHIPDATFVAIDSIYGHDGFLVETQSISQHLSAWLKQP